MNVFAIDIDGPATEPRWTFWFEFSGASLGSGIPEPVGVSVARRKPAQRQLASPTPSLATSTTYEKGV